MTKKPAIPVSDDSEGARTKKPTSRRTRTGKKTSDPANAKVPKRAKTNDLPNRDSMTAEEWLARDLREAGIPFEQEFAFHPKRRWRSDFLIRVPKNGINLLIEVEGRGRHQTEGGFVKDCDKYNAAVELGYVLLRYPASSVRTHKRRSLILEQILRLCTGTPSAERSAHVLQGG